MSARRAAPLPPLLYESLLRAALAEDLGTAGDLTTDAIVDPDATASAAIVARSGGTAAGVGIATAGFHLLDPGVVVTCRAADGDAVGPGTVLATVTGPARAILTAERVVLNLLGRLCGIATATARFVAAVGDHPARIVPTRKTTPGLRVLERSAVRAGGGADHRFGLADGVLIKDNHIAVAGSITEAVERVRRRVGHMVFVEVEVDTVAQLDEAVASTIDAVLLDNMTTDELAEAVARTPDGIVTEASGGVTLESVPQIAATGVHLISVGWLTHSAPALDVGLDVTASASA
ncbi:MAG TPA: carboxylating nicotinate-nucleotide diphosphorylase [Euzebyales bacterium]|nr:carboxylating nicotinate-nucleotide diphosphorylase [Euzebyales bacterium]